MDEKKGGIDWQTKAAKLFCLGVLLVVGYLILTYAKTLVAVIFVVWSVSVVIDWLARRTAERVKLPRKVLAAIYLSLVLLTLGAVIFFALRRLLVELEELAVWFDENRGWIGAKVGEVFASIERISAHISWLSGETQGGGSSLGTTIDEAVSEMIHESIAKVGSTLTAVFGGLVRGAPRALITFVVTVVASFYLSMDYENLRDRLIGLFSPRVREGIETFRKKAGKAVRSYLRAYLLILLLTFAEVFVGLMILGKRYAFLIALLVAVVDVLPILGVGTVLVPWAIVMLVLKNYYLGFGLLILYGAVTIVRQVAEPHIVGGKLGIHPLVSLAVMFAGFQFFGFFGMILGPAVALILKELLSMEKRENEKKL